MMNLRTENESRCSISDYESRRPDILGCFFFVFEVKKLGSFECEKNESEARDYSQKENPLRLVIDYVSFISCKRKRIWHFFYKGNHETLNDEPSFLNDHIATNRI